MNSIGTFLLGIAAVYGIIKYIRNVSIKNETLYGEEAEERFEQLQNKLTKHPYCELKPMIYGGGDIKTPRVEIRKFSYNSKTVGDKWKKGRAILKYYEKDFAGKIVIKRWLL